MLKVLCFVKESEAEMDQKQWKQGDRVRLRSGGCAMMVMEVGPYCDLVNPSTRADLHAVCVWHSLKGEPFERLYLCDVLEEVA